jgi:hypothetical protein
MNKEFIGWLTIFFGTCSLLATVFKWKVFMNLPRVREYYNDLGNQRATLVYVIFSIIFILVGVLLLLGVLG